MIRDVSDEAVNLRERETSAATPVERTRARRETRAARFESLFPWGVWLVAIGIGGWMVARYAKRLPYSDDWPYVPFITGHKALSLDWLWQLTNEHRLVVTKLVLVTLGRASHGNYQVPVWLNLLLLAGISAVAILTMRRVRGYSTFGDAFFPVVLLSLQLPGLNWGFQSTSWSITVSAIGVLLVMTRYGLDVPPGWMWVSAGAMLLLLGSGAIGLALLPGIGVWFALAGLRLRSRNRAQGTVVLVTLGALALGMGLYFIGWHGQGGRHPGLWEVIVTALHAASSPGGDQMSNFWPLSGIVLTVGLVATAVLVILHLRTRESRDDAHGLAIALACFGVAVATVAGAIGFGRGTRDWFKGLETHYSDVMLPLACWAYMVWDRLLSAWRRAVGIAFLVAAVLSYGLNAPRTLRAYRNARAEEAAFVRAMCSGESPEQLRRDYTSLVFFNNQGGHESVPSGIKYLKAKQWGLFDCS